MHSVIDTPWKTTLHLSALREGGVKTIIRYFNHNNSNKLPEKRIGASEAQAIADAELTLCTVFQQRGGAGGAIQDFGAEQGRRDAKRAMQLAQSIKQPQGAAIYFAVDHDFFRSSELAAIGDHFAAIKNEVGGAFRIGVYGSGTVARTILDAGNAELVWLAAAKGWSGTRDMLKTSDWALFQIWPPIGTPLDHDGNTVSAAWPDFGQFTPGAELRPSDPAVNVVLAEVTARSGLNVRRGPGTGYAVERVIPLGTIVHEVGRSGDWAQVDLDGDGQADGHVHRNYLAPISGGFPISSGFTDSTLPALIPSPVSAPTPPTPPTPGTPQMAAWAKMPTPYQVAQAELGLDIREVAGPAHNPRIVMYHNSTGASAGNADEVAWCSSFVNYCVEQAGMTGTNSQWALNWDNWGQAVSGSPREGDIAVFERVGKGGHVGFVVEDFPDHVKILGGNQGNRVKISVYPKDGKLGSMTYKLKSFRRA